MSAITKLKNLNDLSSRARLVFIAVVLVLGISVHFIYDDALTYYHSHTDYVSSSDDFKIKFPVTPKIYKLPTEGNGAGGVETGNIYDAQDQAKGSEYDLYVVHYGKVNSNSLSETDTETILETETTQIAKLDKATLSSGSFVNFKNILSIEATLKPTDTTITSNYLLAFLHGSNIYIIIAGGISNSQYKNFANSFNFVN